MTGRQASAEDSSRTLRLAAVGVVLASFALIAFSLTVNQWVLGRLPEYAPVLRRLPPYEGQSSDPDSAHLSARIDLGAVRRAAKLVPDDALYYVQSPERFEEDIERVARLYFLPAVAVRHPPDAGWILSFRSRSLPRGVRRLESIALSQDLILARVAPR